LLVRGRFHRRGNAVHPPKFLPSGFTETCTCSQEACYTRRRSRRVPG
jgi:hypothetical protein